MWRRAPLNSPIKEEFRGVVGDLLDGHERRQKQQTVNILADLLNDGTHIMQRHVHSDEEYRAWKTDMDHWVSQVATVLREKFGKPEETLFLMLESVVAADIMRHYNKEHNNELLHLGQRLKKLRRVIEKYS